MVARRATGLAQAGAQRSGRKNAARTAWVSLPVPSWRVALIGSLAWGLAMSDAAYLALGRITGWLDPHLPTILVIYFLGGLVAFVPSLVAAGALAAGRRAEVRFSAAFVTLAIGTLAATGFVYGIQYMRHDIDWTGFPGPGFPFMDIPKSMIGAQVYYLVLGARLLAPEGLLPLLIASVWLARRLR